MASADRRTCPETAPPARACLRGSACPSLPARVRLSDLPPGPARAGRLPVRVCPRQPPEPARRTRRSAPGCARPVRGAGSGGRGGRTVPAGTRTARFASAVPLPPTRRSWTGRRRHGSPAPSARLVRPRDGGARSRTRRTDACDGARRGVCCPRCAPGAAAAPAPRGTPGAVQVAMGPHLRPTPPTPPVPSFPRCSAPPRPPCTTDPDGGPGRPRAADAAVTEGREPGPLGGRYVMGSA